MEDQIRHPLKAQPWWGKRGTHRREGADKDLVCKVRQEKIDGVKGKDKKCKGGQKEADVSQNYYTPWAQH